MMPNVVCSDGKTVAGPGACVRQPDGKCGWEIVQCPPLPTPVPPPVTVCKPGDCKGAIPMFQILCSDGSHAGYTGQCVLQSSGQCDWQYVTCPS